MDAGGAAGVLAEEANAQPGGGPDRMASAAAALPSTGITRVVLRGSAPISPVKATKVVGVAGAARMDFLVRVVVSAAVICGGPLYILSLSVKPSWVIGLFAGLIVVVPLVYHLFMDGPRRCIDISLPIGFELSRETLQVSAAYGSRTLKIPAGDVLGVHVYRQSVSYGEGLFGLGTSLRPCSRGAPEQVRRPEEVKPDLVTSAGCLRLICGRRRSCSCAFLAAEVRDRPEPLPLSRRVWHARGLEELFKLVQAVENFRQGQLFIGDVGAYATRDEILDARRAADMELAMQRRQFSEAVAALPTRRLPERRQRGPSGAEAGEQPDLEAGEDSAEDEPAECVICLGDMTAGDVVCTLPCGHMLHFECAKPWLQTHGTCPLCKRSVLAAPSAPTWPEAGVEVPPEAQGALHGQPGEQPAAAPAGTGRHEDVGGVPAEAPGALRGQLGEQPAVLSGEPSVRVSL